MTISQNIFSAGCNGAFVCYRIWTPLQELYCIHKSACI